MTINFGTALDIAIFERREDIVRMILEKFPEIAFEFMDEDDIEDIEDRQVKIEFGKAIIKGSEDLGISGFSKTSLVAKAWVEAWTPTPLSVLSPMRQDS